MINFDVIITMYRCLGYVIVTICVYNQTQIKFAPSCIDSVPPLKLAFGVTAGYCIIIRQLPDSC